jgi:hypothetical protein
MVEKNKTKKTMWRHLKSGLTKSIRRITGKKLSKSRSPIKPKKTKDDDYYEASRILHKERRDAEFKQLGFNLPKAPTHIIGKPINKEYSQNIEIMRQLAPKNNTNIKTFNRPRKYEPYIYGNLLPVVPTHNPNLTSRKKGGKYGK